MIVFVYEETGGRLVRRDQVTVPDNSPDPETAAWTAWTRGRTRDKGNYSLFRAGKRFSISQTTTVTAAPAGPMT